MEDLKESPLFNQKLRERVLTLLYEKEFRNEPLDKLNELLAEDDEPENLGDEAIKIAEKIIEKIDFIDEIIKEFLEHWDFNRIASTDKEALRIGTYEIIYRTDLEPKIVIDRIVRISKKFGEEDSGKFVNGILGAIYRKYIEKNGKNKKDNN